MKNLSSVSNHDAQLTTVTQLTVWSTQIRLELLLLQIDIPNTARAVPPSWIVCVLLESNVNIMECNSGI